MAYFSTEPASECRNVTGKNRVWDFFRLSNETHPANRRQAAQPRRKIRPTATKSASGIPYWPSRDPIEEAGGLDLYGFVSNDPVSGVDPIGLEGLNGSGSIIKGLNQITVPIRGGVGLAGSVLTGDIFSEDSVAMYDPKQCEFLITVSGIKMISRAEQIEFMKQVAALNAFKGIRNPAWVNNPSRFWGAGDGVQILLNETVYAITIPDLRTVKKIRDAAEVAKRNGCACWCITIVAHSQGTEVVKRALDLISPEIKKHISVIGLGGETTFGPGDGVKFALNFAHVNDPVPNRLNRLSFWNGNDPLVQFGQKDPAQASPKDPSYMNLRGFKAHSGINSYVRYLEQNPISVPRCKPVK